MLSILDPNIFWIDAIILRSARVKYETQIILNITTIIILMNIFCILLLKFIKNQLVVGIRKTCKLNKLSKCIFMLYFE